jgi:PPOX class probable F420-dependent enzyme
MNGHFLVYSRPGNHKLSHIARNAKVSLNLDGDGFGGDIVVIIGEAAIDDTAPPAHQVPAYVEKYDWGFQRIGMTAEQFGRAYSVAIRITPTKLRGH